MLHISLGGGGTLSVPPSARTAFRAAPCSHIPAGKTLSAERKKSRRLGAILGSNGLLAVRLLRQSHLFGSGYPVGLCSNSSEQLCLSAAGSANCRSKTIRTVWLNGVDTRARSRARRRGSVAVAQLDQLHVFTAPEGVAGGHGGALPLACPYCLGSEKRTMSTGGFCIPGPQKVCSSIGH